MKESQFIKENAQKWAPLEKSLRTLQRRKSSNSSSLAHLGEDYMNLTDDLSYAQTFYKRRSIRLYLNTLASDFYRLVFKHSKSSEENSIVRFWTKDIPSIMYHSRKAYLISFIIFVSAMIIGAFSLSQNASFANEILSEGYVKMTDENIEKGDPMAVYKHEDSWDMFKGIALNNLKVMTFAFLLGLFFGIGTIGALMSNGVMLGVFQYYFYQKGLLWVSFLTIWQHGTVEISCIIIGGGAGLMLGSGYLFPGNYSRLHSLRLQFYKGMKVAIAIMPFIIFAAFVEAYITRHDDMDQVVRLIFILVNAAVIFGYFVYYPYYYGKHYAHLEKPDHSDLAALASTVDEKDILNLGEIFQLTVLKAQKYFSAYGPYILTFVVAVAAALFIQTDWVLEHTISSYSYFSGMVVFDATQAFYNGLRDYFFFLRIGDIEHSGPVMLPVLGFVLAFGQWKMAMRLNNVSIQQSWAKGIAHFAFTTLLLLGMSLGQWFILPLYILLAPIASINLQASLVEGKSYFSCIQSSIRTFRKEIINNIGWAAILAVLATLFGIIVQGQLLNTLLYFANQFLAFEQSGDERIIPIIQFFFTFLTIAIVYVIAQIGYSYSYNTAKENETASILRERIASIPPRKKRYGIDETL